MNLKMYVLDGQNVNIRPALTERYWMEAASERYPYRCLPLTIANTHGWEILCADEFYAEWNGTADISGVQVVCNKPSPPATSHFGLGVLTFKIPCIFRTEPGYDMMVQGPINQPKDGIAALSGVVETDWSPYSFTMNWKFTRPHHKVHFLAGEPICHVFPVKRGLLEEIEPTAHKLSNEPELKQQYEAWIRSRRQFLEDLSKPDSDAQKQKWQKYYQHGHMPDGCPAAVVDHRTRLKLKSFKQV